MNKRYKRAATLFAFTGVVILTLLMGIRSITSVRYPTSAHPVELYSNEMRDDLRDTMTGAMAQAKKSILLIIYAMTDHYIIKSLNDKAEEGLDVTVVLDAKASKNAIPKLSEKIHISKQRPKGIMHQKLLVVDGVSTWIGSANMTTESLRLHGNLVTGVYSPALAQMVTEKGGDMQREIPHQNFTVGKGVSIDFWLLPDNDNGVSELLSLIERAQKKISIAMFTWTRRDLAEAVIAAHRRGVEVEVIIDRYAGRGSSRNIVDLLAKHGVPTSLSQGSALLHYKMMYVDEDVLVNGSANWTKAAFTQNNDCFLVLRGLTTSQKKMLTSLWENIRYDAIPVSQLGGTS